MEHRPILPATASLESAERFLPSNMGIEPLAAVARALAGFNRDQLGSAIEVLIALMDVADGDVEAEPVTWAEDIIREDECPDDFEEDDPSGQCDEDEANTDLTELVGYGPGCTISDSAGDQAYVEWTTMRGSQKPGPCILAGHEDDEEDDAPEEDDPGGQIDEDGVNTAFGLVAYTYGASGPGCMLADPGIADSGGFYD